MAETLKTLGQSAPGATTQTDLYTCPSSTTTVVRHVVVCNRGNSATTFRIYKTVGGGTAGNQDYYYYDVSIPANDSFESCSMILAATDKLRVYAGNSSLSFQAEGVEQT